jgi:hypothetical protein
VYSLSRPDREIRLAGIFERALAPLRSPIHAFNSKVCFGGCGPKAEDCPPLGDVKCPGFGT